MSYNFLSFILYLLFPPLVYASPRFISPLTIHLLSLFTHSFSFLLITFFSSFPLPLLSTWTHLLVSFPNLISLCPLLVSSSPCFISPPLTIPLLSLFSHSFSPLLSSGVSNLIQQVCRLNKGLRLLNLSKTSLSSKGRSFSFETQQPSVVETLTYMHMFVNNAHIGVQSFTSAFQELVSND